MPKAPTLGAGAVKAIEQAVDRVFDRAKAQVLGPQAIGKRLYVGFDKEFSLPGIFHAATAVEGATPNLQALSQILKVAGGYIDATREKTKARVVREVQSFLNEAATAGVKTDLPTVLGGKLTEVFSDASHSMRRIVDTELHHAKHVGSFDGIVKINAAAGIDDPLVYFVIVRDRHVCDECVRLHMLSDGVTPRVWRLSQVGHGYHKKGESNPKMGGLHPHCRCTLATLMPGYGFTEAGFVTFIDKDHDEYEAQSGAPMKKSEAFDEETERIRERRDSAEGRGPHKFKAAKWTHKNGHPRCWQCGDEERTGGQCAGADYDGLSLSPAGNVSLTKVSLTPESTARGMRMHEPVDWSSYDRIETYPLKETFRDRPMWHHVFYDNRTSLGYQSVMHTLSDSEHPTHGLLYASSASGVHSVAHQDEWSKNRTQNLPWKDGTFVQHGETNSAAPGKGWGLILYREMAKVHGRMASDSHTSVGANMVWAKLLKDPQIRGLMSDKRGEVHHAEYTGPKPIPSKVIEGDGRTLKSILEQPEHPYRFEQQMFSLKSPNDYMEITGYHKGTGENLGVRGLHLDHANKRIHQQPTFRGGTNHFFHPHHREAGAVALHQVMKQTGYHFAGDLPTDEK